LGRAGFGTEPENQAQYIILMRLTDSESHFDPMGWPGGSRTMRAAHYHILDNFENLKSGDVVDVQFILEETEWPKVSERLG
jgi:hypothetical protein